MNKRILKKLAKAGYFKKANGALYAAARRALRKPLFQDYLKMIDEPDQELPAKLGIPHKAVNTSQKASPPNAKKRDREEISVT